MRRILAVFLILFLVAIVTGCAAILPTTSMDGQVSSSDGRNAIAIRGIVTEDGANRLIQSTARADSMMRVDEARADLIKSQADFTRTMGGVIKKNPDYLWYGYGLYGVGAMGYQWQEFQQNIYAPEALIDWNASQTPRRK